MYRAHLYLHPHTHHTKTSTVPGAYPTAAIKTNGSTDFTRSIQLTADKPTQAIGRSSRNEAKGLFAAPSNGFFESPVMSRAHAEVRMVLEPHRKIVIQDTKSMHGTYVNGLQLHPNETAELQQGTEVTFGAEVTRGDDVYPAKTFRCEVNWERLRTPSPRPDSGDSKSRCGYGLSSAELEYESNLDDEDFDDQEMDDNSQDEASSGASSPPRSPPPGKSNASPEIPSYLRHDDIPESHERSTKDSLKHLNTVFEPKSSKIKDIIDLDDQIIGLKDSEERPKQEEVIRPRMPTIHSLVNKTQSEQSKTLKVVDLVDDDEVEIRIIDKPVSFSSNPTSSKAIGASYNSKSIYIDLDKDSEDEDSLYGAEGDGNEEIEDDEDEDDDMDSDSGEAESLQGNDDDEAPGKEVDNSADKEPQDNGTTGNKEEVSPQASKTNEPVVVPLSEPSSPDAMGSKKVNSWGGFHSLRGVLPPIGSLPASSPTRTHIRFPQQQTQESYQRHMSSHTRWVSDGRSSDSDNLLPNFMDSKRDFFDARAKNFARLSAEMSLGADHLQSPQVSGMFARTSSWTEHELPQCTAQSSPTPNIVPQWYHQAPAYYTPPPVSGVKEPAQKAQTTPNTPDTPNTFSNKTIKSAMYHWERKKASTETESEDQEVGSTKEKTKEKLVEAVASIIKDTDTDVCDEDGDYDEEGDYEVGDYYCELESEDEDIAISDELDDIFDDEPAHKTSTTKIQGNSNSKPGYSKFSIDDMMNHESPKGKARTPEATVLASPPSEDSVNPCDGPEKSKAVPGLVDILNPAAPSTPPPTLKRKHSCIDVEVSTPTPTPASVPMVADQDLPNVPEAVDTTIVADYPELALVQPQEVTQKEETTVDRPTKRVKSERRNRGVLGLATAAMAGAVVGGVGMFAALVASAQ